MVTSYGFDRENNREKEDRLIEDVHDRRLPGFDPRIEKVRHQSIGYLNDEYLQRKLTSGKIRLRQRYLDYTRVPPLATLGLGLLPERRRLIGIADRIRGRVFSFKTALVAAGLALFGLFRRPIVRLLPKRYTLSQGVSISWTEFRAELRRALPVAAILGLVIGLIVAFYPFTHKTPPYTNPKGQSGKSANSGNSAYYMPSSKGHSATKSSTPSSQPQVTGQTPGTASSSSSVGSGSYAGSASVSGSSGSSVSGGRGGGLPQTTSYPSSSSSPSSPSSSSSPSSPSSSSSPSSPSSSSSSSSSSLLPNTTLTTPPTSVTVGGKPLVSTSGLNLTLN